MSGVGLVVVLTLVGVCGLLLAASGWLQPTPSLHRVVTHIQRGPTGEPSEPRTPGGDRVVAPIVGVLRRHPRLMPTDAELALVGRSAEHHVVLLVLGAFAGFAVPPLLVSVLQAWGVLDLGWFVPLAVALFGAVIVPLAIHASTVETAARVRADLRYQVSAYLDVVTMLLAGNAGYEGALEQAAHAGDGRLFGELRRRMRESGARGASLTDALHQTGVDLGLDELEQVAATAALSAAEGAPVARTLSAKCATLRAALATEQETEARLRTSRLTTPIVGMALIFMALVIYPALNFV
jgi:Flp pilus assembly protein TadB